MESEDELIMKMLVESASIIEPRSDEPIQFGRKEFITWAHENHARSKDDPRRLKFTLKFEKGVIDLLIDDGTPLCICYKDE